jgi:dTMP kinase
MSTFVTFEGPEGSGKTTQAKRLKKALEKRGLDVLLTREPGGTDIGDAIRDILLNPDHSHMDPLTELFLYEANRSQHVTEVIQPALDDDKIVLCDRYSDASLIYQGVARGIGTDTVHQLNELATRSLKPDLTIILDVNTKDGLDRARTDCNDFTEDGDRIEQESGNFHDSVREGYRKLAEDEPDRCVLLSKQQSIEETHESILNHVNRVLDT